MSGAIAIQRRSGAKTAAGPAPASLSLAEVQAAFQRAVVAGDDSIMPLLRDSSRTDRAVLLGVYRHAYKARLVEIIRSDFDLLADYLGEEVFDELARLYIDRHPSTSANARWVSRTIPEFLALTPPYSAHQELVELAAIQRAISSAFDSPDTRTATIADLTAFPPEQWSELSFAPHPSVCRLDTATNAYAIWRALHAAEEPPAADMLAAPERLIVWRDNNVPMLRCVSTDEASIWDAAAAGGRFGSLCELLADLGDPAEAPLQAARHLQSWLANGLLSSAVLTAPVADG